jgi:hypothetical protein
MHPSIDISQFYLDERLVEDLLSADRDGDWEVTETEWEDYASQNDLHLSVPEEHTISLDPNKFKYYADVLNQYATVLNSGDSHSKSKLNAVMRSFHNENPQPNTDLVFSYEGIDYFFDGFQINTSDGLYQTSAQFYITAFLPYGHVQHFEYNFDQGFSLNTWTLDENNNPVDPQTDYIRHIYSEDRIIPSDYYNEERLFRGQQDRLYASLLSIALERYYDNSLNEFPNDDLKKKERLEFQNIIESFAQSYEDLKPESYEDTEVQEVQATDFQDSEEVTQEPELPQHEFLVTTEGATYPVTSWVELEEDEMSLIQNLFDQMPKELMNWLDHNRNPDEPDFKIVIHDIITQDDEDPFSYNPEENILNLYKESLIHTSPKRMKAWFIHELAHVIDDFLIHSEVESEREYLEKSLDEEGLHIKNISMMLIHIFKHYVIKNNQVLGISDSEEHLPQAEFKRLQKDSRIWNEKSLSIYCGKNAKEFFAHCLMAYFNCGSEEGNEPLIGKDRPYNFVTRKELKENLPLMHAAFKKFFDPNSPYYGDISAFI